MSASYDRYKLYKSLGKVKNYELDMQKEKYFGLKLDVENKENELTEIQDKKYRALSFFDQLALFDPIHQVLGELDFESYFCQLKDSEQKIKDEILKHEEMLAAQNLKMKEKYFEKTKINQLVENSKLALIRMSEKEDV